MKQISFLILLLIPFLSFSQNNENSLKGVPASERIMFGGGIGLGFGNQQDYVVLSPVIGYKLTEKFIAGTGVSYRYTKYKGFSPAIKLTDYSINPFARYMVYQNIFLQAEYEHLNYEFPLTITETTRKSFNSFMAGGGFMQPLGGQVYLFVMALYNFSYTTPQPNEYAAYDSPWVIRAGINIGNFGF